jgi:folylpolyglutamate synthase/dihydropteroate synthase
MRPPARPVRLRRTRRFDSLPRAFHLPRGERQWAVIEVGWAATRSTNIVDGEIAVVTNIELEHTEILGKTRRSRREGGILKPGAVLITLSR